MTQSLRDAQLKAGGTFATDRLSPVSFGNDSAVIQAAQETMALYDRSNWGCIQVSDADRLTFLHNQSTNDFNRLKPGEGCDTVFVTSTARTIDLATAYVLEDNILVLVSPNRREKLMTWLDRYIFFGDKVKLADVSEQKITFNLIGPESSSLLEKLGAGAIVNQPYGCHQLLSLENQEVRIAVGSGLALPGYTLILEAESAATVWQTLQQAGATPFGDQAWEQLRIQQGRPMPNLELTEDYNPLETGLWNAVSFNKGCYIGQETIARLDTYKGVKQRLWGLRLSVPAEPGTPVTFKEEKVGVLTSLAETGSQPLGLAYIRTKAGGAGLKVQVGNCEAEVVSVPFLTYGRQ